MMNSQQRLPDEFSLRAVKGLKTVVINIVVNICLAVIKVLGGVVGNSYALIADGIESITDIFSSTVVYSGFKVSAIPPDKRHPYGYGKAESLAALIVSCVLIGAAVAIVIQSIREVMVPHHAPAMYTLFILMLVIAAKEILHRFMLKVGKDIDSLSIEADAWHSRSDALTSLAAFIGISIAVIGGKGYESADDWAALFASGIIFFNGFRILRSAVAELMDAVPAPRVEQQMRELSLRVSGVRHIEKCLIRKSGYGYFAEMHIGVDGKISVEKGHDIAHAVKDCLLKASLSLLDVVVHIEPYEG